MRFSPTLHLCATTHTVSCLTLRTLLIIVCTMTNFKKTRHKKHKKPRPKTKDVRKKSSTMQIPVEKVFEDISVESVSHLDISCPGRRPMKIPLTKNEMTLGRDESCSIHLSLSNVSSNHARLRCRGEEYVVEDLESTNGTYVNNIRVSRCVLRNNDRIRIGEAKILFVQQKIRKKS